MIQKFIASAALASIATAGPVSAQAPDLARCEGLYARFERYSDTGGETRSYSKQSRLEAIAAIEECRRGNIANGIAILEKLLRAMGFRT